MIYLHVGKVSQWYEHSSLDICNFNALQAAVNNIFSIKRNRDSVAERQIWWAFTLYSYDETGYSCYEIRDELNCVYSIILLDKNK